MEDNILLYVHIPFCQKKCNYCDFLSFNAEYQTIDLYINKLLEEIEYKKHLANNRVVSSIYIGGGTPSYIDKKYIKFIMDSIKNNYNISNDCEISIELNPNSANIEKLQTYYEIGINRLSFGVQSIHEDELKMLGRIHTYNDFLDAYNNALHIGFKNINVDIINGIPLQTKESYKKTLKQILTLQVKHISIYNLIIEPNTNMYKFKYEDNLQFPNEEEILQMDNITYDLTKYFRLNRYEVSNYAKDGYECRHNNGYWDFNEYLGFGLNSSSYYNSIRYKNKLNLNKYLDLNYKSYLTTNDKNIFYEESIKLNTNDKIFEYIMLGFRKTKGINAKKFFYKFNEIFENLFYFELKKYIASGHIIKENDNYYFSKEGFDVSNSILCDFMHK